MLFTFMQNLKFPKGENFLTMQEKHKEQVSLYKKAIEEILKKPNTKAFIVYCLENEIKMDEI